MHSGRVPSFRMKPQYGTLMVAFVILVVGILGFYESHSDPGNLDAEKRGYLLLAICIVVSGVLIITATSRMWFRHLWHQRYK